MNKRSAFTLIELLVVIAIIAILAAILFPVFAQAKLAAKKTTALSNAKQIALGHMMYMNDYDDHLVKEYFGFPAEPTCDWNAVPWGTPGDFYGWRWAIQPYLKNYEMLRDQTNPFADPIYDSVGWAGEGVKPDVMTSTNFAVNNGVIGFANGICGGSNTPEGLATLDQIDDVASTIIIVPNRTGYLDLKWFFGSYGSNALSGITDLYQNWWCNVAKGAAAPTCPATGNGPIHAVGKQTSWVWADGHARAKAYSQTLRLADPNADDWWATQSGAYTLADRVLTSNDMFPEYK